MKAASGWRAFCAVQTLLLVALVGWKLHGPLRPADAQTSHTTFQTSSPSLIQNLVDAISQQAIAQHILYLQDDPNTPGLDSQGTRHSRSPGLAHAAAYISDQFAQLGLNVEYDEFLYLGTVITNVVATLPGVGPESDGIYIVGAHFDSTAQNTPGWNWQTGPAPGADDNASGTAVVLELARVLSQDEYAHTLRFITFGGEEQGLLGSAHYARNAWLSGQDIRGVINLDMAAWDGDGDRVMEVHAGTRPASIALAEAWNAAVVKHGLNLVPQTLTVGATTRSDHASFWMRGYAAILLIEDAFGAGSDFNPYYHSVADTFEKLDMSFTVDFARATVATIAGLAEPIAPDLTVSKLGPDTASSGSALTYTLTYSNTGRETATDVRLTEMLPEGLAYLSDDSGLPGSDLGPGVIGWQVGALAPGEGDSFSLVLVINEEIRPATLLTNTVLISAIEAEADLEDNAAVSVTTVAAGAPAHVEVVALPSDIPADGASSATITATVTDRAGHPVEDNTPVTFATSLGTVVPPAALTQNGVTTTTLVSEKTTGTAVVNVVADQVRGEALVAFQPADVFVTKIVEPPMATPGDTIRYTLAFRNLGPAVATRVNIVGELPLDLHDLVYDFAGVPIIPGDFPEQWRVADLAPGEGGVITIAATVDTAAFWRNSAALTNETTISSDTVDVHPENNSSTAIAVLVRRIYLPSLTVSR